MSYVTKVISNDPGWQLFMLMTQIILQSLTEYYSNQDQ